MMAKSRNHMDDYPESLFEKINKKSVGYKYINTTGGIGVAYIAI